MKISKLELLKMAKSNKEIASNLLLDSELFSLLGNPSIPDEELIEISPEQEKALGLNVVADIQNWAGKKQPIN